MGFQTQVNVQPAPAVEGDFASANPRSSTLAGEGALIAGAAGVIVGRFAYAVDANGQPTTVQNAKPGSGSFELGFVHRDQLVVNTVWLAGQGNTVYAGLEMTMFNEGDFWARFPAGATRGQKVFVVDADGTAKSAAAGATVAGATETGTGPGNLVNWYVKTTAAAGELAKISTRP